MFWRSWVRIPAAYMDIFSLMFIVMFVWKDENNWKRGRNWPIKKQNLSNAETVSLGNKQGQLYTDSYIIANKSNSWLPMSRQGSPLIEALLQRWEALWCIQLMMFLVGANAENEGRGSQGPDEGGVGDVQAAHLDSTPSAHWRLRQRFASQQRSHPHHRAGDEEGRQGQNREKYNLVSL